MTRRFVAGLGIPLIFVVSVGAQTLKPIQTGPDKFTYPGHVTVTTSANGTEQIVRLISETGTSQRSTEIFEAQARTVEVKYGGLGVTVLMKSGSYTATDGTGKKTNVTFSGTLRLAFVSNGGLAEIQVIDR